MTEIPDHLLKRSKERRAAIGGEDSTSTSAPADDGDTSTEAITPTEVSPPISAVRPDAPPRPASARPEVAAALQRHKIPFWALPVLVGLPLWAYVYQATLEPPPAGASDPLVLGEEIYSSCAGCHGPTGGGTGAAPALTGVLETWPDYRDHLMWVRLGDVGWPGTTYGAPQKPKGIGMPSHTSLTDAELAQVVLYERTTFGGLDPTSDEYAVLLKIAEGLATLADAGLGEVSAAAGVDTGELTPG